MSQPSKDGLLSSYLASRNKTEVNDEVRISRFYRESPIRVSVGFGGRYVSPTKSSKALWERAAKVVPSGIQTNAKFISSSVHAVWSRKECGTKTLSERPYSCTNRKVLSAQAKQDIRIKPSFVPFAWKGFVVVLLGLVVYAVSFLFEFPLRSANSLLRYAALVLIGLGILGVLIGAVRRNAFTYFITDSDVVVQKQLLGRSVRRIPFSSISDVQVSQSLAGRLARYGDIVPVTKSGYGLVRGTEPGENIVAEMVDVPNPDKVADLIMSRLRSSTVT